MNGDPPTDDSGEPAYVTGTLTFDEYDWNSIDNAFRGVVQLDLDTKQVRRFLDGRRPWRHPNGSTVFLQSCGNRVSRVAIADSRGLFDPVTACSSEIQNPEGTQTNFGVVKLSPDANRVAVEALYFDDELDVQASVLVFDLNGSLEVAFDDHFGLDWTPDGRLVVGGRLGLYVSNAALTRLERIDGGQLNGRVGNLSVRPSGGRIVFEFNQQIWEIGVDGSDLVQRAFGPIELRFPAYSPSGEEIVFLGLSMDDFFERAIFFVDLSREQSHRLDLRGILGQPLDVTIVPNGPVSWSR